MGSKLKVAVFTLAMLIWGHESYATESCPEQTIYREMYEVYLSQFTEESILVQQLIEGANERVEKVFGLDLPLSEFLHEVLKRSLDVEGFHEKADDLKSSLQKRKALLGQFEMGPHNRVYLRTPNGQRISAQSSQAQHIDKYNRKVIMPQALATYGQIVDKVDETMDGFVLKALGDFLALEERQLILSDLGVGVQVDGWEKQKTVSYRPYFLFWEQQVLNKEFRSLGYQFFVRLNTSANKLGSVEPKVESCFRQSRPRTLTLCQSYELATGKVALYIYDGLGNELLKTEKSFYEYLVQNLNLSERAALLCSKDD